MLEPGYQYSMILNPDTKVWILVESNSANSKILFWQSSVKLEAAFQQKSFLKISFNQMKESLEGVNQSCSTKGRTSINNDI